MTDRINGILQGYFRSVRHSTPSSAKWSLESEGKHTSSETGIQMGTDQRSVVDYFDAESSYWQGLYSGDDVFAIIHQQRRSMALQYFDELSLPNTARVLEVGCGAGLLTVDLARRGYTIEALDRAKSMVELTRRNALECGAENSVKARIGDVCQLPFSDATFECLIALGVLPWVANIHGALKEVSRVLVPGGYAIFNVDNRHRLNHLLDPADMPALAGLKARLKKMLSKSRLRKPSREPEVYRYTLKEFDQLLTSAGLVRTKYHMIGFGPFSFFKYEPFSGPIGVKLHRRLQQYSDRGSPLLRSTGSQILVAGRKA